MVKTPIKAYDGDKTYMFVCYAHDDAEVIYPELTDLAGSGLRIWYDEGISPSSEWTDSLASAIEGCSLFLYYLSPRSALSEHCRREIGLALDLGLKITVVALEPAELRGGLRLSLGNLQSIMRYQLSPQAYLDKLQFTIRQALDGSDTYAATDDQSPITERRPITVINTDVVDLSTEPSDPEDWLEVVQNFQVLVRENVERFEGRIAQFSGDGAVGYFGHPLARENDAERAVRCGLSLVDAKTRQFSVPAGVQVGIRIAINSGTAIFQNTEGTANEAQATGVTPGIAERLRELNQINEVILSDATVQQLKRIFRCVALGEYTFTGVAGAVTAYRVLGEPTDDNDYLSADAKAPFVGRELELAQLNAMFERASAGKKSFALLLGEPGIGKSRVVDEFRRLGAQHISRTVVLQCSPFNINSPFRVLINGLRRDFALDRANQEDHVVLLKAGVEQYGLQAPEHLTVLAALLDIDYSDKVMLSVAAERRAMIEAVKRWLLAGATPVVIVVEDVHWLDPSSIEVLDALINDPDASGVMMVLTARPEFEPQINWRGKLQSIPVERLLDQDIEGLIASLTNEPLSDKTRALAERSDGIPLFAEALVKTSAKTQMVPNSLQELLVEQLDRLGEARVTAQVASVFGREFDTKMLMALAHQNPEVIGTHIARLLDSGLIFPARAGGGYVFKHALVQEMAYQTMVKKQQQALHLKVGNLLTVEFPDLAQSEPHVAAAHFSSAGESVQAVPLWLQAGRDAFKRSAHVEAAGQFRRGIEQLSGIEDAEQRVTLEIALQTHLGETLSMVKGYAAAEAIQAFERAHELSVEADQLRDTFRAVSRLQAAALLRSHMDHARALATQLNSLAIALGDIKSITQANALSGITAFAAGEYVTARDHFELAVAAGIEHPGQLASVATHADAFLINTLWDLGLPDSAVQHARGAQIRAAAQQFPFNEAAVMLNYCGVLQLRGEFDECIAKTDDLGLLCKEHSFVLQEGNAFCVRGAALAESGQVTQGIEQMLHGIHMIHTAGQDTYASASPPYLAAAYMALGDLDTAEEVIDKSLVQREERGLLNASCEHLRVRAEIYGARNEPQLARKTIRRALKISLEQECLGFELRVAMAFHALTDGDDEATNCLKEAYQRFTEGFDTLDLRNARALID